MEVQSRLAFGQTLVRRLGEEQMRATLKLLKRGQQVRRVRVHYCTGRPQISMGTAAGPRKRFSIKMLGQFSLLLGGVRMLSSRSGWPYPFITKTGHRS